ncbi:ribonuclease H-like domain-containing protein [Mycena sp. CBHHK59/15]|nr:ribonuclease H-like domain-containing protein [Mycena sp. CBHHK59/15]
MSAKRSKKKHPGVESWMWQLFHKGPFYKDNKTYREARCRAEVKLAQDKLKTEQEEKIRHGVLPSEKALADAELHTLALNAVIPFCGKPEKLRSHIRTCDHVEQKWKLRLEKEKESDDSDNDTSTPTVPSGTSTSAVTLPQKRKQATFSVISEPRLPVFKKQKQKQFESDILKFWTVLNASYNSIEIPFVTKFFNDWVPGAELPGRRALSGRILDTEVENIQADIQKKVKDEFATASVDGWSTKHDAIQQTSFNVKGQEYALNVHVTTNERKTSANLLTHVLADLQMLAAWGAFIVAFCCDSGGDSRGLRPLLLSVMPWILTIPCWAHQINLVVKDYIKNPVIVQILSSCLIVINWFSSHKRALFMLLEQQQKANEARPPGEHWERLKRFVRAAITRWGTHALSTRRLLDLKKFLVDLVNHRSEDLRLAGGSDEDSITAATAVIILIDSGSHGTFWSGVERVNRYLTPLAVAANITQGANTRLDHVVITLVMLHRLYSTSSSFEYPADNQAICESLEKRWRALKHDQDFYILAVFLNPFLRGFYFDKSIHSLGRTGLFAVVKRVYRRMHNIPEVTPLPSQLFADYLDYYDGKGNYTADAMNLDEFKDLFENKVHLNFLGRYLH